MKKIFFASWIKAMALVLVIVHNSCNDKTEEKKTVEDAKPVSLKSIDYDLSHPVNKWSLSDSLAEISGIAWLSENKFLAIEDLHPLLYELDLKDSSGITTSKTEFRKTDDDKMDFEDLVVVNDTTYALWSHGAVFKIIKQGKGLSSTRSKTWLTKDNNTEGLAHDPVTGNLLIACKEESGLDDVKKSTRAIFEFDRMADSLKAEPFMLINKNDFENVAGEKIDFYPSAIAVHPTTHDIYILSTKDTKAIAQFGHDKKLKAFDYIDKEMLPQPEGMCFDPQGNLYISTESRHHNPAYIYKFVLKSK
jgi:uncharacterized protein YjiK